MVKHKAPRASAVDSVQLQQDAKLVFGLGENGYCQSWFKTFQQCRQSWV